MLGAGRQRGHHLSRPSSPEAILVLKINMKRLAWSSQQRLGDQTAPTQLQTRAIKRFKGPATVCLQSAARDLTTLTAGSRKAVISVCRLRECRDVSAPSLLALQLRKPVRTTAAC